MKFTVTWKPVAINTLASIWLEAAPEDRPEITDAVRRADQMLQFNPESAGESRLAGERIVFVRPLALRFQVRQSDRVVAILAVRRVRSEG